MVRSQKNHHKITRVKGKKKSCRDHVRTKKKGMDNEMPMRGTARRRRCNAKPG